MASAMCHMANISYLLGEKVPFSAQRQAFGDDRAAYATLARLQEHLKENNLTPSETEYMLGPSLEFDVKNEKFVGNNDANKMLSRDYREPFTCPTTWRERRGFPET